METKFYVDTTPVGKGRPRVTRYGTYTPKKTRAYEDHVRKCWIKLGENQAPNNTPLFACIRAYFPIPKSYSKRLKESLPGAPYTKKPDADNIVKAVLDALNGVAYEDDSKVCSIFCSRHYTEDPIGYSSVTITDDVQQFIAAIVEDAE